MTWTIVDHVEVSFADGNAGHVVSLPGGGTAVAGDIDAMIIGSDTTVTTPSGFTLPTNGTFVSNQGGYAVYRICTGGESASVTVTTSGNFGTSVGFVRVRGGAVPQFDHAANAHVDSNGALTSLTLATGALIAAGEFVYVGSVMTDSVSAAPSSPVWSGATGLGLSSTGATSAMSAGIWGYNDNLGTATSNLSVSWSGDNMRNRYIFMLAFKPSVNAEQPTATGTAADAAASVAVNAGAPSASGVAFDAGVTTGPNLQAFDSSGSTAVTVSATSATVNITSAAVGAWCYAWVVLGINSGAVAATGWSAPSNAINSDEGTSCHYALLRRQKQSGDTTFSFTWTTATKGTIGWVSYTGLDGATPDEQAALTTNGVTSRTAVPGPSATPTTASRWMVNFFGVRTTNVANKPITWTPDAATTERLDVDNNAAGSAPWCGIEIADSGAPVTQAAHSATATHNAAESHDGSVTLFLISSTAGNINAPAESPTAAGVAADASVAITATAEAPTGAGAAADAGAALGVNAEAPTGAGQAFDATVAYSGNIPAEAPSGTGVANAATAAVGSNAEAPTGAGVALDGTAAITAVGDTAMGAGTAADATAAVGANAAAPTATGQAFDTTVAYSGNIPAEVATATGQAFDATVQTSGSTGAPAEVATAAGTANTAAVSVGANAVDANATGAALDASAAVAGNAEAPTAAGQAFDATVSTSSSTSANAQSATAAGTALDASAAVAAGAGVAAATGTAYDATIGIYAVGVAIATGQAFNATVQTSSPTPPTTTSRTRVVLAPQRATVILDRNRVAIVMAPQRDVVIRG